MPLTRKVRRQVAELVGSVFSTEHLLPMTRENIGGETQVLYRTIWLKNGGSVLLSHVGNRRIGDAAEVIEKSGLFSGEATYGDILTALRDLIADTLVTGTGPESGGEIERYLCTYLQAKIDLCGYALPLIGMKLKARESISLGPFVVCKPSAAALSRLGVKFDAPILESALECHKGHLWLMGSMRGTHRAAFDRFRTASDQLTGFIAMFLGSIYEQGGYRFGIRVATSADEMPNRSSWISWRQRDLELCLTRSGPSIHLLEVDEDHALRLEQDELLQFAFALPLKANPTELERALLKAAVWLNDATHERLPTMRLLKLWSCVEIFFSSRKSTTRSVCDGLAMTLLAGTFKGIDVSSFEQTVRRLKKLYNLRSRATHGGNHAEVTTKDFAQLTEWVSGMMVSMLSMAEAGAPNVAAARLALVDRCSRMGIHIHGWRRLVTFVRSQLSALLAWRLGKGVRPASRQSGSEQE